MPTKKESRADRPAPIMPEAVTSTAAWAIRRLDAELGSAIDGVLADRAQDPALTLRGYWLLEAIGPAPAHSQRELCDLLGIDRSDMVRLIDVLEGAGLVERVRDTTDRRRRLVGPTAGGAELRDSIRAGIADAEARVFAAAPDPMRAALAAALGAADAAGGQSGANPESGPDAAEAAEPAETAEPADADGTHKKPKKKRKSKKKGGKRQ